MLNNKLDSILKLAAVTYQTELFSFGLLPSYRSAASTATIPTPSSVLPPPSYDETLASSQLTASTYVPTDYERASMASSNRLVRPYSDRNNNHASGNRRR